MSRVVVHSESEVVRRAGEPAGYKASWVTRRARAGVGFEWAPCVPSPRIGDVLLCTVAEVGLHSRLETATGQRAKLYSGDRIVCAVGGRYATSLLEAVPEFEGGRADLVSASGLCGKVVERSDRTGRPTSLRVEAQAFLGDEPLNLRSSGLGEPEAPVAEPAWILVAGSAMDSGKTTACTALINGLSQGGHRVGAAKLTGTASARDVHSYRDAGASPVLDFLDCGWPSTAGCAPEELLEVVDRILAELRSSWLDAAVLEVADGLLQPETATLLASLHERLGSPPVVFTARESMSGVAGAARLTELGYRVGAVSGVVTSSPLACREIERGAGVPCIRTHDLARYGTALARLAAGTAPE